MGFDPDKAVKQALRRAVQAYVDAGNSREQAVDALNEAAELLGISLADGNGRGLKLATLEKWLNPQDRAHAVPVRAIPVIQAAFGTLDVLDALARGNGGRCIGADDAKALEKCRIQEKIKQLNAQLRRM